MIASSAVDIMTPILLAALGGLFTERAGILNIGLEGLMLLGAFFCLVFTEMTGSFYIGIILGSLVPVLASALFGAVSQELKANIYMAGLGVNLLALGVTSLTSFRIFGTRGNIRFQELPNFPVLTIPFIEEIPVIGGIVSSHSFITYLTIPLVILISFLFSKTAFGMRIDAAGLNSSALYSHGVSVKRYRYAAVLISGFLAGLGGGFLSLRIGAYVPNISSGRGWIALVAIFLGSRKPWGTFFAVFAFSLAESIANSAQNAVGYSPTLLLAFPYIATLAGMVIVAAVKQQREKKKHYSLTSEKNRGS
ncbi:MAG: ABC transporter permease [Spirochaetia bacterium]